MSENQQFESDLLGRLRGAAPQIPAELTSATGPAAQRVLARVLATPRRDGIAGPPRDSLDNSANRTAHHRPSWAKPQTIGAATVLGAILAIVLAIVVIAGGGASSIVARAYAATDPSGVIVHYVETSRSASEANGRPIVTEIWTYGQDSRQVFFANDPRYSQDIVISGGEMRNLTNKLLVISPSSSANTRCAAAIVLEGDCVGGQNNSPIVALRSLYRSGKIRVTGHTKAGDRRVDVLTGRSNNLQVRALIDARTFLPLHVTMIQTFSGPHPVTYTLMITGYQRLPVTARNLRLLALPAHPRVRVVRMHSCPTKANPQKLCASARSSSSTVAPSTRTALATTPAPQTPTQSQARFVGKADVICRAVRASTPLGGSSAPGGALAAAITSSDYFGQLAQGLDRLVPPVALKTRFTRLVDDDRKLSLLFKRVATTISQSAIASENAANVSIGRVFRDASAAAHELEIPECG